MEGESRVKECPFFQVQVGDEEHNKYHAGCLYWTIADLPKYQK